MTTSTPAALIKVDRVVKTYGSVIALDDVSLDIQQGEFVALLGPSGCGKTTLLRLIAGFLEPTKGTISIDGVVLNNVPPNKRPVNTVFQNYALFPHLTVAENIAFGPRRRGVSTSDIAAKVDEALAMVTLQGFGGRYPSQLSGGQQQRVALARAIVNRPRVLLLDEPLGALDLKLRKRMQIELKQLQEKLGIAFVFVTHDQEEALVMADRIAVMDHGRLEQVGTGTEIYRKPATAFVAGFVGETNFLKVVEDSAGLRIEGTECIIASARPSASAARTAMVRPEDIALAVAPDTTDHIGFDVTVRDSIFIGSATRVLAIQPNGEEIVLQPPNGSAAEGLTPGQVVPIHWRRDKLHIFDA